MQVVMNKCFLLDPEKKLTQIRFVVFEKKRQKSHTLIPKNDVIESKARRQDNSNNRLKSC